MIKFAILRCLNGKEMLGIAKAVWEVMALFGNPKIIQSDNGTEFVNNMVEEIVSLNGINHRTISSYNPRANGQVERVNQVIEYMLKKELDGVMHEWADFVPYVQLSYNAKISTVTGSTPSALRFVRRLNDFERHGRSTRSELNLVLWKERQGELADAIYPAVADRVKAKNGSMINKFSKSHRLLNENAFPKGASVVGLVVPNRIQCMKGHSKSFADADEEHMF